MNTFQIKLLAITTMVIDHIGLFLYPDVLPFRIIGRLSFPLFVWLIANGALYTKSVINYLFRLVALATVSELVFMVIWGKSNPLENGHDILVTLSLGLLAIILIRAVSCSLLKTGIIALFAWICWSIQSDYGAAGILLITTSYIFYTNLRKMFLAHLAVYLSFYTIPVLVEYIQVGSLFPSSIIFLIQPVGILSFIIIGLYNGQEGKKFRLAFYLFYPVHLSILYVILLYWL
jgi:hypothetical protein